MVHVNSSFDQDRLLARDPSTPPAELARIAAQRPDLHAELAANPATSPALLEWLARSPDPGVHAALAARQAAPKGRKWPLVVAGLVTLLVLALGTVSVVVALRMQGSSSEGMSNAWLRGAERTWEIEGQLVAGVVDDGRIVITWGTGSEGKQYTSYDVSGSEPKLLHTEEVSGEASIVGHQLHVDGTLVDMRTGERTSAPWDEDAWIVHWSEDIVVVEDCSPENCELQGWASTSATSVSWELKDLGSRIEVDSRPHLQSLWVTGQDTEPVVVDTHTGKTRDFAAVSAEDLGLFPMRDGWLACGDDCVAVSADGQQELFTFAGSNASERIDKGFPLEFSNGDATLDQVRAFVEDNDVSWSRALVDYDSVCMGFTVNGFDLRKTSSTGSDSDEDCPMVDLEYARMTDNGKAALLGTALYNITDGSLIHEFGERSVSVQLCTPTMIVVSDGTGSLVGYRPA